MPIYEYECSKCGDRFEVRRGLTDSDTHVKCPKCRDEHPKRVFSSFATNQSASCAPTSST